MSQAICEATISARRAAVASCRAPVEADAELIRLCAEVLEIESEQERLCAATETIEDERRIEPALIALYDKRNAVVSEIEDAIGAGSPTSAAGALAMARAALALANRDAAGDVWCESDGEWLAFSVVEFLLDDALDP